MAGVGYWDAIRLLALREVTRSEPTGAYGWRKIARYYSEKWHTPLHVVEKLDPEKVLQAFWEDYYERLEPDDREEEARLLTFTADEARAHLRQKDLAELRDWQFKKEAEEINLDPVAVAKELRLGADAIKQAALPNAAPRMERIPGEVHLPAGIPMPAAKAMPVVKMEYGDPSELEILEESDGIGTLAGLKP